MHPGYGQTARGNNQAGRGVTKGIKTSEESNHSSEASGATPGGGGGAPPGTKCNRERPVPSQKSAAKASKRVPTLPLRLGGYCRVP
jgi:hypothetical protein